MPSDMTDQPCFSVGPSRAHLPTKLGQPSTSSPRTLESNRRRLGNLFSSLAISSQPSSQSEAPISPTSSSRLNRSETSSNQDGKHGEAVSTPSKPSNGGSYGSSLGFLAWLTPKSPKGEEDEGCFLDSQGADGQPGVDTTKRIIPSGGFSSSNQEAFTSPLMSLPDELITLILSYLRPSARDLLEVGRASKHLHRLSESPILWSRIFHSTPGFKLLPGALENVCATNTPPAGHWDGEDFISTPTSSTSQAEALPSSPASNGISSYLSPARLLRRSTSSPRTPLKPIHWPTLYRSRLAYGRIIHDPAPSTPPIKHTLKKHTDSVYCLFLASPWLVTGSRDKSIRIWHLGDIPDPTIPTSLSTSTPSRASSSSSRASRRQPVSHQVPVCVNCIENAHSGSVLSVKMDNHITDYSSCTMITGSSDNTAGVWTVDFGDPSGVRNTKQGSVKVERVGTLRGHEGGVLDVALSKTRIATGSKDTTIRIYSRDDFSHLFTLRGHHNPVNGLSLNPNLDLEQVVSASGDAHWIIWDMKTGGEVRRGGGDGRGLACVTWEGDHLLTGDNDRLIKLYNPRTSELIRTFEGHTDLVRAVALDLPTGVVVSGSYDQSYRMWDLNTGEMIRRVQTGYSSLVFGVGMQAGRVVSVSHDGSIQILTYGAGLPYRAMFA